MKKRKKLSKWMYWQNCPVCGDKKRQIVRYGGRRLKRYAVSCSYCCFRSEPAFTKYGARKKWNKATNVVIVKDVKGGT